MERGKGGSKYTALHSTSLHYTDYLVSSQHSNILYHYTLHCSLERAGKYASDASGKLQREEGEGILLLLLIPLLLLLLHLYLLLLLLPRETFAW